MGARTKLNSIHAIIALGIAVAVGLATNSWVVFAVVLGALIAVKLHSGAIRPSKRRSK